MKFRGDMKNYYFGKVCERHPEEKGLRTLSRRTCVACAREVVNRCRQRKKDGNVNK